MATVYFTNNASTGAGSLAEAVANAQSGDTISPDASVFTRGSAIDIYIVSRLYVSKHLTIDGGAFRIRLNGGGSVSCLQVLDVETTFRNVDFVDGFGDGSSDVCGGARVEGSAVFERCRFLGCCATSSGSAVYGYAGSRIVFNDCLITGGYSEAEQGAVMTQGSVDVVGSTIVGNIDRNGANDVGGDGRATFVNSIIGVETIKTLDSAVGSVVSVALSQIGFAAAPPDGFNAASWSANAWQNWNLRLLDDASPTPSQYRDSGVVEAMTKYDLDGNFRGRVVDDSTTCSPGAYETIQADLFWVGVDSTGSAVASPVWNAADGWAASRFAAVSGNAAPPTTAVVFVDGSPTFAIDSFRVGSLIVGGGSSIGINNTSGTALTLISTTAKIGVGATFRSVSGTSRFQVSGSSAVWEFADYTYFPQQFYFSSAQGMKISPTSQFATVIASAKLYANGIYNNYNWQISGTATVEDGANSVNNLYITFQNLNARISAIGSPRVSANAIKWTIPTGATSDYTVLADGSTPIVFAPRNSFEVVGMGSTNDFIVDVTGVSSLTATLGGQTAYGDASSGSVTLNGDVCVGTEWLKIGSLTLTDGASVKFSGGDSVLSVNSSIVVSGAVGVSGSGYFATPYGSDLSSVSFESGVASCDYGANVLTFDSYSDSLTSVQLSWTKGNEEPGVLLEKTANYNTSVIYERIAGTAYAATVVSATTFRIFDGDKFLSVFASPPGSAYELAESQTIGYLKTIVSAGYIN